VNVEVVYATPEEQKIITLELLENSTVHDAVVKSALQESYPEIQPGKSAVGIYGERVEYETVLKDGDRVEIYRPLMVDPMEARRLRARTQTKASAKK